MHCFGEQEFIRQLRESHEATIPLTTHDMQEADLLCDRIMAVSGL